MCSKYVPQFTVHCRPTHAAIATATTTVQGVFASEGSNVVQFVTVIMRCAYP